MRDVLVRGPVGMSAAVLEGFDMSEEAHFGHVKVAAIDRPEAYFCRTCRATIVEEAA